MRQWARRGNRLRQPAYKNYTHADLFSAICPARGNGGRSGHALCRYRGMQARIDEISRHFARGAHAVLLMDRAGRHTTARLKVPENITRIFLPSRAPELNPVENAWQYLRAKWLSNRGFANFEAIIDAACDAWRKLVAQPHTITSIGLRDWAHVSQVTVGITPAAWRPAT